jgi:hypothetical protein
MSKLNFNTVVNSSLRGLFCAGLSTVITAFFSWSFVTSTDNLDWMGSGSADLQEIALLIDDHRDPDLA